MSKQIVSILILLSTSGTSTMDTVSVPISPRARLRVNPPVANLVQEALELKGENKRRYSNSESISQSYLNDPEALNNAIPGELTPAESQLHTQADLSDVNIGRESVFEPIELNAMAVNVNKAAVKVIKKQKSGSETTDDESPYSSPSTDNKRRNSQTWAQARENGNQLEPAKLTRSSIYLLISGFVCLGGAIALVMWYKNKNDNNNSDNNNNDSKPAQPAQNESGKLE